MTATPIHDVRPTASPSIGGGNATWVEQPRPPVAGRDDELTPSDLTAEVEAPRRRLPVWAPWFLGRVASGAAAVLALSAIVFVATQALPSDPARVILGPDAPEATARILRAQLGLDQPLVTQYAHWLRHAAVGDFGRSLDSHVPVLELVGRRLHNTALLLGAVAAIVVPLALALGAWLALRRDTRLDRAFVTSLIVLKALPVFAIAIGLVMLFATSVFDWLPAVSLVQPDRPLWDQLSYLVLPTVTLVLSTLPYLARLVRASMIEALDAEHVTQARLRGIPEGRVLWRHAVPTAIVPAVQGIALTLSVLVGGTIIVEVVFAYPGIGSALNAAVGSRDIPVLQGLVLIVTTAVVGVNLAADLLTVLLTPRLRSP